MIVPTALNNDNNKKTDALMRPEVNFWCEKVV